MKINDNEKIYGIVNEDILFIQNALDSNDEEQIKTVHMLIDGKYSNCIPNLGKSMYGYNEKNGFVYQLLCLDSLKHNLLIMKAKLEGYLCNFPVKSSSTVPQNSINVTVPITNQININITFEQAKQQIEDMPGLTAKETEEILERISELETISKENISKKNKWEKVKPILTFALDKSVDVAIAIMSLILQMKLGM